MIKLRQWSRSFVAGGLLIPVLFIAGSCVESGQRVESGRRPPRLAVMLVVDQARPDYLSRFAPYFTGGFRRLLDSGVVFPNAFHDHANTETAVGHAALSTGSYPSRNGIIANEWYERAEKRVLYCCEDSAAVILNHPRLTGRSPKRLLVPAIGDWLKQQSPESKVVSVAIKDRAAILLGGHHPDGTFWFDRRTGDFVTSSYYADAIPTWLDEFNARRFPDSSLNSIWSLLLADSAYIRSGEDAVKYENDAVHTTFPHHISTPDSTITSDRFREFVATPFADQFTLRMAEQVVQTYGLGGDSIPDILCVSLSAADWIGHRYGPSSWEVEDYYLRLDGYLNTFLGFLDRAVGADRYVIALSSDHGVTPFPEQLAGQGATAYRLRYDSLISALNGMGAKVASDMGLPASPLAVKDGEPLVNYATAERQGVSAKSLDSALAVSIGALPYVADLFTRNELMQAAGSDRPYEELFRHVYHDQRGPDLYLRLNEFILVTNDSTGASHGTPYTDDANVPMLFFGSGIGSGGLSDRVETVDLAPTLADLLGIEVPAAVDGQSLRDRITAR